MSIVVDQTSRGVEFESLWAATENFRLYAALDYIDVDDPNPSEVAPT